MREIEAALSFFALKIAAAALTLSEAAAVLLWQDIAPLLLILSKALDVLMIPHRPLCLTEDLEFSYRELHVAAFTACAAERGSLCFFGVSVIADHEANQHAN